MSLILSGTNGLSDVDGDASTPAIRGTDGNTGIFFGADVIGFSEGGTECARFNSSGNLQTIGTISVGNATPSTSGAGITFPATQSASSDANTLDDYEEGTWTGTLKGSTTDPTTPVTVTGYYTKVGRQVSVVIEFSSVSTVGASGTVTITGLPFTCFGSAHCTGSCGTHNFTFENSSTGPFAYAGKGTTTIVLLVSKSNSAWGALEHSAGTGRFLYVGITYFV
jgi:hypothetical protein